MTNEQIKKRIKLAMSITGVSYERAAEGDSVSKQCLYARVNTGRVSIGTLEIISKATKVPVDWFITDSEVHFYEILKALTKTNGLAPSILEEV